MHGLDDLPNVFDFSDGNDPVDPKLIDLFNLTKSDATAEELTAQASTVTAMLAAMQPVPTNVVPMRSFSMRDRFAMSKAATKAAIISGVVLFSATAAAAASGNLPDSAQSVVSRAVSHVGIHIDNPEKSAAEVIEATSTSSTIDENSSTVVVGNNDSSNDHSSSGVGPNANGDAKDGLCHSFNEHLNSPAKPEDSVAMKNLQEAATAAHQSVAAFCASTTSTSDDHGANKPAGSDDATKITTPGQSGTESGSGSGSGSSGKSGGLDDTTQTTAPTVTVAGQDDPTVSTSSPPDDRGGSNRGGGSNPKP